MAGAASSSQVPVKASPSLAETLDHQQTRAQGPARVTSDPSTSYGLSKHAETYPCEATALLVGYAERCKSRH